jgi:uncharacterized phage protein (TIGR01671 family)
MNAKFRVWDKKRKVMIPSERLGFSYHNGEFFAFFVGDLHHSTPIPKEDIILMRSTGLTDVDGNEIYEGDLLEHEMEVNGIWEPYEACEVVYNEDEAIFNFKDDGENLLSYYQKLKVVGHIYEV